VITFSDSDLRLDAHRYTHTDSDTNMVRHSDTRTCTGSHSYLVLLL